MTLQNFLDETRALMTKHNRGKNTIFVAAELRQHSACPDSPPVFELKISAWMNEHSIRQFTGHSPDLLLSQLEQALITFDMTIGPEAPEVTVI